MRRRDLSNPKRLAILSVLRRDPSLTYQEVADATGQSRTNVVHHIRRLEAEGVIIKTKRRRVYQTASKADAGRQGRGVNAFVPREKPKGKTDIEKRIDAIVMRAKAAQAQDPGHDVINHNPRRLRLGKAVKIG
jgi:DNA-binding transcriptional ArsR family regulator